MTEIDITPAAHRIDTEARKHCRLAIQTLVIEMTSAIKSTDRIKAAQTLLAYGYGVAGKATITPPVPAHSAARLHGVSDEALIAAAGISNRGGGSTPQKGDPTGGVSETGPMDTERSNLPTMYQPTEHRDAGASQKDVTGGAMDVGFMSDEELAARLRKERENFGFTRDAVDGEFFDLGDLCD